MIRLLLADEHPLFRTGLVAIIQSNFVDCDIAGEASTGDEALAMTENLKPNIIIIDSNLKMINGNSDDVLATLHRRFPKTKVIVLISSEKREDILKAVTAGASACLLKTSKLSEILASVNAVINGESVLSPIFVDKLIRQLTSSRCGSQRLWGLTARENEILQFAANGDSNKEIAQKCCLSVATVKAHIRNILGKLEVKNRTGAVFLAESHGLLADAKRMSQETRQTQMLIGAGH